MLGLLFLSPHLRATSSGSTILNSPQLPSHEMQVELAWSLSNSIRNCHNWICPPPAKYEVGGLNCYDELSSFGNNKCLESEIEKN